VPFVSFDTCAVSGCACGQPTYHCLPSAL